LHALVQLLERALVVRESALKTKMPGLFTQALRSMKTKKFHRITGILARTNAPQNAGRPFVPRHVRLVVERLF
jgi:hypothetical protein